jgi:chitodextrinase
VAAFDASNNVSQRSSTATATTLPCPDVTPPTAPAWISLQETDCGQVTASWATASDVGTGVDRYELFNSTGMIYSGPNTSHTSGQLAEGVEYVYGVRAVDGHGNRSGVTFDFITISTCSNPNQPPTANAGPNQTVNVGDTVNFNGSGSTDSDGQINYYAWNFGDGTTTTGVTASHSYDAAGTYTVTLSVVDDDGALDTDTAVVTVNSEPDPGTGDYLWSKDFGGPEANDGVYSNNIAIGSDGSIVVAGSFTGNVAVEGSFLPTWGDLFIIKYRSNGAKSWATSFSAGGVADAAGVAVDASGNIYMIGSFFYPLDLGGNTLTSAGNYDMFLAKYSSTGNHLWSMSLGGLNAETARDLAIDSDGNLLIAGEFRGSLDIGSQTVTSNGNNDMFLAKLTSNGDVIWARNGGGTGTDGVTSIAIGPDDSVAVTGYFQDTANFGGSSMTSAGEKDIFVVEYNTGGAHLWSKRFGSVDNDEGRGVAVDPVNGDVALTGVYRGAVNFGDGTHPDTGGGADWFIARFTAGGQNLWSLGYGDSRTYSLIGNDVDIDEAGNVLVTGTAVYSLNLGGEWLHGSSGDVIVAKFSMTGDHVWSSRHGDLGSDVGTDIDCDADGNVLVAGYFTIGINFGGQELSSPGRQDGFLVKFTP